MRILLIRIVVEARSVLDNAAVEQCPKGICLELLVLPAAERRGESGVRCSTAAFPPERSGGGNNILNSFLIISGSSEIVNIKFKFC
jgi:hypothetical protein